MHEDLVIVRKQIPEPGRYYHSERAIVLRQGLLIVEERRALWHELTHHDRGDRACHTDAGVEQLVERTAVRRALPLTSLRWALGQEIERHRVADMLKLPEEWIQFRLEVATPKERRELRLLQEGLWAEEVA